MNIIIWI